MEYSPDVALDFSALVDQGRRSTFQKALLVLLSRVVVLDGLNNQIIGIALPVIPMRPGSSLLRHVRLMREFAANDLRSPD